MSSFHGFRAGRKSRKSHLRTASLHGFSRDSGVTASNVPDLHGFNLQDIPTLDINKATSDAVLPSEPVSPHILTPHLHEIQRMKLTLLQIQNMIHSNDELILNVRQNLLRRMVNYLNSVKTKDRASTEYQTMVEIKADVDDILKEQGELIVSLRQDKLKQLVDLKPKTDTNQPHFRQGKLHRQVSRSVESVLNPPDDSAPLREIKPALPRLKGVQRSETARAERSLYFSELAKKSGGNAMKRNKSMRPRQRRKSVEDIYAGISDIHMSRASTADTGEGQGQGQQSFLKLGPSGQLVFDTKTTVDTAGPQATGDRSRSKENSSETIGSKTDSSKTQLDTSKTQLDSSKTQLGSSKTQHDSSKTQLDSLKTQHASSKTMNDSSKTQHDSSKAKPDSSNTPKNSSKTKESFKARDIVSRKPDSSSKEIDNNSKPKDCNSNQITEQNEITVSSIHDKVIVKAKQHVTEPVSKAPYLQTRSAFPETFDSANPNYAAKSKTQCTQTSPQASDIKGPPTMFAHTVSTLSKKTQTDTKITKKKKVPTATQR